MTKRLVIRTIELALLCACSSEPRTIGPPHVDPPAPTTRVLRIDTERFESEAWTGRIIVVHAGQSMIRVFGADHAQSLNAIVAARSPAQPFFAINGGFYAAGGVPMGLIIENGNQRHPLTENGGSGVFAIDDGQPIIVHRDSFSPSDRVTQAMQSIDRLVDEGHTLVTPRAGASRAARSAVAIDAHGEVFFAVAFDERAIGTQDDALIALDEDSGGTGPTMAEWADLLIARGAVRALGLDGGFSTSLIYKSNRYSLTITPHGGTIGAIVASAG